MGVLQIYVKPGRQFIEIPNHIDQSNFKLVKVQSHFNVENHGFYQGRVYLNFLPANLVTNSLRFNRSIVVSFDHTKSYTDSYMNMDMGAFSIPRSFEVDVDLDNGLQVVEESNTKVGQPFAFKKSENSTITTDYVVEPVASDRRVSLGLFADKVLSDEMETTAGDITAGKGVLKGPVPFLYSMILTFSYDDAVLL